MSAMLRLMSSFHLGCLPDLFEVATQLVLVLTIFGFDVLLSLPLQLPGVLLYSLLELYFSNGLVVPTAVGKESL